MTALADAQSDCYACGEPATHEVLVKSPRMVGGQAWLLVCDQCDVTEEEVI